MSRDISNKHDISIFVDAFYDKIKHNQMLGPIFFGAIKGDWQPHLDRMYGFWDSVLFSVPGFTGNPFAKHATLRIGPEHFDQWLLLFENTIDSNFSGPIADEAKYRARLIGKIFESRLEDIRKGKIIGLGTI